MSATGHGLSLPRRTSPSLEEDFRTSAQELAMTSVGAVRFMASWWDELKGRPFDIPRYTAAKGTPSIVIYLSSNSIATPDALAQLLETGPSWSWCVTAFLDCPYPLLRCSLLMPDTRGNPYVFESPLNIRSGDVQEFCVAAASTESIDIVMAHELLPAQQHAAVAFAAPGLPPLMRREFERARQHLRDEATEDDFQDSIDMLERTYPSATDGLERRNTIRLSAAGPARNATLDYEF